MINKPWLNGWAAGEGADGVAGAVGVDVDTGLSGTFRATWARRRWYGRARLDAAGGGRSAKRGGGQGAGLTGWRGSTDTVLKISSMAGDRTVKRIMHRCYSSEIKKEYRH